MSFRLAPHRHVAVIGDRVVLLDTMADRYSALGMPAATIFGDLEHADADSEGMSTLLRLGVVEPGPYVEPAPTIGPALCSAVELAPETNSPFGFVPLVFAIAQVSLSLRWRGLAATLDGVSKMATEPDTDRDRLIAFAQAYARQRSRLAWRHICLPDSIAMHRLLAARGLHASLVIGVRLNPFGAHCWLQANDMVLNDSCDTVSGFTPILVI